MRSHAEAFGIDPDFFANQDIHIHVPAGGIPKDGPSAGIAMVTALVSLLSGRQVRPRLAMTGEISLSGIVLPIGGVKEKVLGAKRAGIKEVILPADNEPNVKQDLQPEMLEGLQIHYVKALDQVLEIALSKPDQPGAEPSKPRTAEAVPAPQLGARFGLRADPLARRDQGADPPHARRKSNDGRRSHSADADARRESHQRHGPAAESRRTDAHRAGGT